MDGGNVYDLIRKYPNAQLSENEIAYITGNVLKAITFMHSLKRIHRDIKAENILLNAAGEVKLADFGTAVQLTFDKGVRKTFVGSHYYIPPEVISRDTYSEGVDIWCVGILVYEMMTGKPPYAEYGTEEAMNMLVEKGISKLEVGSDLVLDFVNNLCLQEDVSNRASAEEALMHEFLTLAHIGDLTKKIKKSTKVLRDKFKKEMKKRDI